nr:MAG TPA: hypothetical protein [Caudoviricetes sp.]
MWSPVESCGVLWSPVESCGVLWSPVGYLKKYQSTDNVTQRQTIDPHQTPY